MILHTVEVHGCKRPTGNGYKTAQYSKMIKIDTDVSVSTAWEQYIITWPQAIKVAY